jgi:hypothetical protein
MRIVESPTTEKSKYWQLPPADPDKKDINAGGPGVCSRWGRRRRRLAGGDGSAGIALVVSPGLFHPMFSNRNPFYTYDGMISTSSLYPDFVSSAVHFCRGVLSVYQSCAAR